jgi:hypothetical protein
MTRRVRAFSIAMLLAFLSIASQLSSPAWSAHENAEPYPGGETDEPQGDEGGDADEVLIRTTASDPIPDSWIRQQADRDRASQTALSWWHQALRWLGFKS